VSEQPPSAPITPAPAAVRVAGQHARATQRQYANRALIGIFIAAAVLVIAIATLGVGWITVAVEAVVIVALLTIDSLASPIVERWGRGAAGEERVGQILDGLRDSGWYALHDVNLGRGNIDHVLIGPAGIFTIETKSHRGRINTAKIDKQMTRQAYAEGKLIEKITGLRAESLLVFSNAYLTPAITHREGVVILPARMLAGHLQRRTGTIPAARVTEVYTRLATSLPG
jgi:hypothetical protein